MEILHENGYAIDKNVDIVINSSNGFLLLGKGGSGQIRKNSEKLDFIDELRFHDLLFKLSDKICRWYERAYNNHGWDLTKAQLSCIKLLVKNGEFKPGSAVLDGNIIHIIAMSYNINGKKKKIIPATVDSVTDSLREAFKIAKEQKSKSIAIPVLCSRETYGLNTKESLDIINSVLKDFKFEKVIICYDNDVTKKYLVKHS